MKIDFFDMNERVLKSVLTKPIPPARTNLDKASTAFATVLEESVNQVADLQKVSKDLTKGFMMGTVENIHDVTIASEKAGLAMKTLNTMRKKVLEAYRDISSTRL